jgi:NADPH:quinone reductase-like Zn-dependent oxidoreductase
MRQYQLSHRKDFSGLTLHDDIPKPKLSTATEVMVKIRAVSLNARDLQIATDQYPAPHAIKDNLVPVSDAAGEIVEVGGEVEGWKVGDRVCTVCFLGHDQVSTDRPKRGESGTYDSYDISRTRMCRCTLWFEV